MKKLLFCFGYLLTSVSIVAQTVSPICNIPAVLNENSGIIISNANRIWLHNDGGDSAKLYALDTFGTVLRTIIVQNANNHDWEDITQDDNGNLYIGDFGNNNNNRQNLRVYKIPHPDSIIGNSVMATEINFHYPQQTAFPAPDADKNYDAEALLYFNDSLYIFTKDRTTPHLGYTRLYQIPSDTGFHTAILIDSFPTGQTSYIFEITGAAISSDKSRMALINASTIWLFSNFVGNDFFGGTIQSYSLGAYSQKEALDFVNNNEIYFSNETNAFGAAKLARLSISPILNTVKYQNLVGLEIFPNPSQGQINLTFDIKQTQKVKIVLHDITGKRIKKLQNETLSAGQHQLTFSLGDLVAGVYFLKIKTGKQKLIKRIVLK